MKCETMVDFIGGPRDGDSIFHCDLLEIFRKLLPKPPPSYEEIKKGEVSDLWIRLRLEWQNGKYIIGNSGTIQKARR